MEHYVGLDVSLKQTAICVVDQAGKVVSEGVVVSDPEAIATFVKLKVPCVVRIGLETGATPHGCGANSIIWGYRSSASTRAMPRRR